MAARPVVGDVGEGGLVAGAGQGAARKARRAPRRPRPSTRSTSGAATTKTSSEPAGRARTYSISGPTATAAFEISVHGVVVQTSSAVPVLERRRRLADRKPHVYGRVLDVLVALGDLVRGERRAAARAVGDDLVALVEAPVVPDLAQRPPDRLDVGVGERHVGVVEVDPEPDPLGEPVPFLDVAEHRLAAALVELGDPVGLDLGLRGDPQLPLDLQLDRQAVAVPAGLAGHPVAAHGLVAGVDVLEDARQDVVRAGLAVGGRRPLVEAPHRSVLALRQGAVEHVALAPALEDSLLELGEGLLRVHRAVGGHRRLILPSGGRRAERRRVTWPRSDAEVTGRALAWACAPRSAMLARSPSLVAGCGSSDGGDTPAACLAPAATYLKALEAAPERGALAGETPISGCLVEDQAAGDLADVGAARWSRRPRELNAAARRDPGGEQDAARSATWSGAVQEGASRDERDTHRPGAADRGQPPATRSPRHELVRPRLRAGLRGGPQRQAEAPDGQERRRR